MTAILRVAALPDAAPLNTDVALREAMNALLRKDYERACETLHEAVRECEQRGLHAHTLPLQLTLAEAHLRAESVATAQLYATEAQKLAEELNFDSVRAFAIVYVVRTRALLVEDLDLVRLLSYLIECKYSRRGRNWTQYCRSSTPMVILRARRMLPSPRRYCCWLNASSMAVGTLKYSFL